MHINEVSLADITVRPYFPGLTLESAPAIAAGQGSWQTVSLMNHRCDRLVIDRGDRIGDLADGQAYSWTAEGGRVGGHWTFCTDAGPRPVFGVVRNASRKGIALPLGRRLDRLALKTEPLRDIVVDHPVPYPGLGVAQSHLGKSGWLVMVTAVVPACIGILIEDPSLPQNVTQGVEGLFVSATSARTLQTVAFNDLLCVAVGTRALFLKSL